MPTTMKLIGKTTLASSASSIEFTGIPGTGYTDLYITASLRNSDAAAIAGLGFEVNGSTTNYSYRWLRGNGSAVASSNAASSDLGVTPAATATANTFGSVEIYIPNYAGSTNKSYSATVVTEDNATTAYIFNYAVLWANTAAITSVKLIAQSGNFVTNSSAYLYGITKA